MGVNLYAYGKGNPLRYADYNGHESIQEYLTLEERLQRDETDQLWRCIYTIDTDDLKRDILNFDPKSSDRYITLGADILSYGTGMRFLRYLSPEYIKRTANMVIKGNYCNDFTVLGLAINVAIAFTGLDIVQDLRDLSADFTVKFEPKKPEWWLSVGIDFLAVLPVIGLLKYLDETSTGFKSMKKAFVNSKEGIGDSIQYLLQNVPDNLKKIASIQELTKHFSPLRKGVKETLEETGQKSDDLLENIQAIDKKIDIKDVVEEVGEGAAKAGVGKTGEGIPLEEVKPDVLKQIHSDNNGAYGYIPNEGTAYHNPKYDFTDVDWAKDMQNVRKDYLEASKQLEIDIERMTSEGFSKEDIAKHVVYARNQQKVTARANMTAEERAGLETRNIKKYGNPIGPTVEGMFNKMKESYIDKGLFTSDEQIWNIIIEKSMVKDDVINTLLGLIH